MPDWATEAMQGAGVGAGLAFAMPRARDMPERRYSIWGELAGPEKSKIGEDIGRMQERTAVAMKTMADPFAMPVTKFTTAAKAATENIKELIAGIRSWGDSLMQSQEHLKNFSGVMAEAYLQQERRQILRAIQTGARTGGTVLDLQKSLDEFKDQIQPYKDLLSNIFNEVAAIGLTLGTAAAAMVKHIPVMGTNIGALVAAINAWLGGAPTTDTAGYRLIQHLVDLDARGDPSFIKTPRRTP